MNVGVINTLTFLYFYTWIMGQSTYGEDVSLLNVCTITENTITWEAHDSFKVDANASLQYNSNGSYYGYLVLGN